MGRLSPIDSALANKGLSPASAILEEFGHLLGDFVCFGDAIIQTDAGVGIARQVDAGESLEALIDVLEGGQSVPK